MNPSDHHLSQSADVDPGALAVVAAFLKRYFEDLDRDELRSVQDYQSDFSGYEAIISREYARLQGETVESDSLDEASLSPFAAATLSDSLPEIPGFRIHELLGERGMGMVYHAEQFEPLERRVALKVIKLGMNSREIVARFESERQAFARMEHPSIARVYDAGETTEGRPYFVMEHVPGIPITNFCDDRRLSIEQRLELFNKVCDAVQHAHHRGIIHRDLKPSNILVTEQDGVAIPKVIDFGIAKSTEQRLNQGRVLTEIGQVIGTPEYMSPEQAELGGTDIDTRSDIYSLGVILYELLVGDLPFSRQELIEAGAMEVLRLIASEEPPKPTTRLGKLGDRIADVVRARRTDARALARNLRGDLDWIVMKALEKNRSRRFASASEFRAEVERHLRHEPLLVAPPSLVYRTRKFARRYRVSLSIVSAILLVLIASVWGTSRAVLRENARKSTEHLDQASLLIDRYNALNAAIPRGEENWLTTRARYRD
jgi:serine/threonine protein kinase